MAVSICVFLFSFIYLVSGGVSWKKKKIKKKLRE